MLKQLFELWQYEGEVQDLDKDDIATVKKILKRISVYVNTTDYMKATFVLYRKF